MDTTEKPRALSADERVAEGRITGRGIPFLEANYPRWREDLRHAHIGSIADPQRCLLCWFEKLARIFGTGPRNYHSIVLVAGAGIDFHEVCRQRGLSFDDAVACGFARAKDDPPTFYAALRDRWLAQREAAIAA